MDSLADAWPEQVRAHIRQTHGEPLAIERLGGMSVAQVYRVRVDGDSVIVKSSPRSAEASFYERVADRLRQAGVPIPELELVLHLSGTSWLIIEDIPTQLPVPPADRWQPDSRVVAVLARLHRATRGWQLDFPPAAGGRWTDQATDAALRCFPSDVAAGLEKPLRALRQEADHLQQPWCWISGDPSPPNWGVRDDGSVALFDWELFRPGVPASDLAPSVPGLGDAQMFRQSALAYLAECRRLEVAVPWSVDELARDIAVAKLATVVLLLQASLNSEYRVPAELVARLVEHVPAWVRSLDG